MPSQKDKAIQSLERQLEKLSKSPLSQAWLIHTSDIIRLYIGEDSSQHHYIKNLKINQLPQETIASDQNSESVATYHAKIAVENAIEFIRDHGVKSQDYNKILELLAQYGPIVWSIIAFIVLAVFAVGMRVGFYYCRNI